MNSDTFAQPSVPRFDGHYDHWSMLMENLLRSKEYWQVVSEGLPKPVAGAEISAGRKAELESLKLKDLKAKNYLFQAIDRSILEIILQKETSKDIWDSMKTKYQGSLRARRQQLQALRSEFEIFRMNSGESVTDFFSRLMTIVSKMRAHGENMVDVTVIEKVLRSMTPKFNYVVCAIEESKDIDGMSIDELQGSLLVHERKLTHQDKEEQALKAFVNNSSTSTTTNRGRGGWKRNNGHRQVFQRNEEANSNEGQRSTQGRSQTGYQKHVDKSHIECFKCHRYGHYKSECRTKVFKGGSSHANLAKTENEKEELSLLMAICNTEENQEAKEAKNNLWYLDTGCSNHMCGNKSLFSYLDETHRDDVKFGDHSRILVMGKGKVSIHTKENSAHIISSVLFVPDLKTNLLSIGQLQEKGYEISIKNGVCKVIDEQLGLIAQSKITTNRLFPLYLNHGTPTCFVVSLKDDAWLWHFRYGHLNFNSLKILQQKNMVKGLPQIKIPSQVCADCVVSKQSRDQFPQGKAWRAKKVLELVHSDLCGPIKPATAGGKRYFITLIDDYSRKMWVYLLETKSEAFSTFTKFKASVEREAGCPIKILRTDQGGEYTSLEFRDFCETHGIKRQFTAAYSPQQTVLLNGEIGLS